MARIETMRFDGRRFGYKVGNSQIGVKEYFDVAEKLQDKITDLEGDKEIAAHGEAVFDDAEHRKLLKRLDGFYRRLRAVESRMWTPMESFAIDRPSEDGVNLETFVRGQILARIEGKSELETSTERQAEGSQAVRAESASV